MQTARATPLVLLMVVLAGITVWGFPLLTAPDPAGDEYSMDRVLIRQEARVTEAALYLPAGSDPVPGVVFGAGSGSDPAMYAEFGEALARNGVAVLIPGATYDLEPDRPMPWMIVREDDALWTRVGTNYRHWIEYLESHPRVDAERLVIGGHSGGANGAYRAAYDRPDVRGVVAIAGRFPPNRSAVLRTNLLLVTGSEDSLVPPSTLVAVSESLTGTAVKPGEQVGSVADGTAVRVFVVDGGTHLTEGDDPRVVRATTEWVLESVGLPVPADLRTPTTPIRTVLVQFGAGMGALFAALGLLHSRLPFEADERLREGLLGGVLLVGLAAVLGTTISRDIYSFWPTLAQLPKYALFAVILGLGGVLRRRMRAKGLVESRPGRALLDILVLGLAVGVFVLLSTRFVTFQLVTTVVLSTVGLTVFLVPTASVLALLRVSDTGRWLPLAGVALLVFPAVVPPYL